MNEPVCALLPGHRLHLQHGPIDLVIEGWGERAEVDRAYEQAWQRFQDVLETLVSELPALRAPLAGAIPLVRGPVARRMVVACWPHRRVFLTPMAAVAGAVADEMLAALLAGRTLAKAYVNDGGDIAFHVAPGESLCAGIVDDPRTPLVGASLELSSSCGIATSGWRGRSQSLGIADAVTVVARNAASADAAATLIANAVNVDHPAIRRMPARELKLDSDLGDLPVTVAVGALPEELAREALDNGLKAAHSMRNSGLIEAAYLALQGATRTTGDSPALGARSVA
jgi:ApbE superfamily uncharacterized protein (UPF0280 family)